MGLFGKSKEEKAKEAWEINHRREEEERERIASEVQVWVDALERLRNGSHILTREIVETAGPAPLPDDPDERRTYGNALDSAIQHKQFRANIDATYAKDVDHDEEKAKPFRVEHNYWLSVRDYASKVNILGNYDLPSTASGTRVAEDQS